MKQGLVQRVEKAARISKLHDWLTFFGYNCQITFFFSFQKLAFATLSCYWPDNYNPHSHQKNSWKISSACCGICRVTLKLSFHCFTFQGASSPEPSSVYVDLRALRNDRVSLVERGSPHSLCLLESGKLLPGVKVIIANPDTKGQCGDSHLGEVRMRKTAVSLLATFQIFTR